MQVSFNRQNYHFGELNNNQTQIAKLNSKKISAPLIKVVDILNQRGQVVNKNATHDLQSAAKLAMHKNKADDMMLTPQDAARITTDMSKVVSKFDNGDPNAIVKASLIRTEAMSIEDAVSSIPRKINSDGTITAPNLEELRENGLSPEINYEELDAMFNFKANYRDVQNVDNVKEIADYFASTYAVLRQRIQNNFAGEEHTAQLEKLDTFMDSHINRFSTQFADAMGNFNTQIGVNESKDKFYQSVKEAIYDQVKQYQEYMVKNPDYARINDTLDAWLNSHTEYMSSNLRSAFTVSDSVSSAIKRAASNDLYSKNELSALSSFAKTASEIWNKIDVWSNMSEEEIGLRLGMMALEVDILADKSNVSDQYKNMAAGYTQKVAQTQIDKVNNELKAYGKPFLFPEMDSSVIKNIVDAIRNEYAQTKNISNAIQKGAALGYTSFNNRLNAFQADTNTIAPHRYSFVSAFWNTMYANEDSSEFYLNPSVLEKFHTSLSNLFNETISVATCNLDERA